MEEEDKAMEITRDEARRSANGPADHISTISPKVPLAQRVTLWPRSSPSTRQILSRSLPQMFTMHAASACSRLAEESGLQMTTR